MHSGEVHSDQENKRNKEDKQMKRSFDSRKKRYQGIYGSLFMIMMLSVACGKTEMPEAETVSENTAETSEMSGDKEGTENTSTSANRPSSAQGQSTTPSEEAGGSKPKETEKQLPMAEDFTVYDAEGNEVKLSDRIGRPVIVYNWAVWCPPCRSELPDFQEAYETYGDMITFMMIDVDTEETVEEVEEFMDMYGYTFPVYFDTDGIFIEERDLEELPVAYAIDAKGHMMGAKYGTLTKESLHDYIEELLAN